MNVIQEIERIKEAELANGIYGGLSKGSWHEKYSDSAWVYLGGFSYELSEGDIICVMSQWGEIEDINLIRDKTTGKSQGFAFVKYEDQRSTVLAVDNFNGIKLLGRVLRCDHVDKYKLPKDIKDAEAEKLANNPDEKVIIGPGHAYEGLELENEHDITKGVDLWNSSSTVNNKVESENTAVKKAKKEKKEKKDKKKHKKEHKKDKHHSNEKGSDSEDESDVDAPSKRRKESLNDDRDDDRNRSRRADSRDRDTHRGRSDSRDRRNDSRDRDRRRSGRSNSRDRRGRDDRREDPRHGRSSGRDKEQEEVEEARRLAALHAEKQAATTHRAFGGSASVGAYKGPVLPPGEAPMTSWRGKRDPLLVAASQYPAKKPGMNGGGGSSSSSGNAPEPPAKRDEFAGFGGMKRLR